MLYLANILVSLSKLATISGYVPDVDISYIHNSNVYIAQIKFRFTWRLPRNVNAVPRQYFQYSFEKSLALVDIMRMTELGMDISKGIGGEAWGNIKDFLERRKVDEI